MHQKKKRKKKTNNKIQYYATIKNDVIFYRIVHGIVTLVSIFHNSFFFFLPTSQSAAKIIHEIMLNKHQPHHQYTTYRNKTVFGLFSSNYAFFSLQTRSMTAKGGMILLLFIAWCSGTTSSSNGGGRRRTLSCRCRQLLNWVVDAAQGIETLALRGRGRNIARILYYTYN